MSLAQDENKVQELIKQDKKDEAVQLLFKMVVSCARAGRFQKAEALRKQIMEINSLALNEIVNSAEIIESEKAKAIDPHHMKIWAALYDNLSDEEANHFYFSLKKIILPAGKMIMQQGRVNNRLFLVDSGIIRIIVDQDQRQVFLKEVVKGEPVGCKTFFTISYATVTAVTKGPVTLHYLRREALVSLAEKYPGIDSRLESLCAGLVTKKVEDILKNKLTDRRHHKRFVLPGKVVFYCLDSNGQPGSTPVYGVMEDISQGGLSFTIRQSNKQTARMLLGSQALLNILPGEDEKRKIAKNGRVTSVYNQLFDNYLINFKFHKLLLPNQILALVDPKKAG